MKYKHIEASREVRLWLTQVIVPATLGAVVVLSDPQNREFVGSKVKSAKETIKSKFSKPKKEESV